MPIRPTREVLCTVPLCEELQILNDAMDDARRIVNRLKLLYGNRPGQPSREYHALMAAECVGKYLVDLSFDVKGTIEDCHRDVDENLNRPRIDIGHIAEAAMLHEARTDDEGVILLGAKGNDGDGAHRPGDAPVRW
jgi:hypothetical protein